MPSKDVHQSKWGTRRFVQLIHMWTAVIMRWCAPIYCSKQSLLLDPLFIVSVMSSSETKAACPSRVVRGDCIWMLPAHLRCMQCLLFPQPYTALAKAYLRQTYWHGDVLFFSGPSIDCAETKK